MYSQSVGESSFSYFLPEGSIKRGLIEKFFSVEVSFSSFFYAFSNPNPDYAKVLAVARSRP